MKRTLLVFLSGMLALTAMSNSFGDEKSSTAKKSTATKTSEKESAVKSKAPAKTSTKSTAKTESKSESKTEVKKEADGTGRLPRYFASLVDDTQRAKIYQMQEKYRDKIAALRKEIEELESKQMAEFETVLTASQRKELQTLREGSEGAKDSDSKKTTPPKKKSS